MCNHIDSSTIYDCSLTTSPTVMTNEKLIELLITNNHNCSRPTNNCSNDCLHIEEDTDSIHFVISSEVRFINNNVHNPLPEPHISHSKRSTVPLMSDSRNRLKWAHIFSMSCLNGVDMLFALLGVKQSLLWLYQIIMFNYKLYYCLLTVSVSYLYIGDLAHHIVHFVIAICKWFSCDYISIMSHMMGSSNNKHIQ